MLAKANNQKKKKTICQIFQQKHQKVMTKIEEMADFCLKAANFAPNDFFYFEPKIIDQGVKS